ncbi:hypothetical protein B0H14DRAFT_2643035 [Mycena olivaceomarginata]|nr:hypothetical protein B0H14DRAFT_2643035 [Mycena olivaceomarginata]
MFVIPRTKGGSSCGVINANIGDTALAGHCRDRDQTDWFFVVLEDIGCSGWQGAELFPILTTRLSCQILSGQYLISAAAPYDDWARIPRSFGCNFCQMSTHRFAHEEHDMPDGGSLSKSARNTRRIRLNRGRRPRREESVIKDRAGTAEAGSAHGCRELNGYFRMGMGGGGDSISIDSTQKPRPEKENRRRTKLARARRIMHGGKEKWHPAQKNSKRELLSVLASCEGDRRAKAVGAENHDEVCGRSAECQLLCSPTAYRPARAPFASAEGQLCILCTQSDPRAEDPTRKKSNRVCHPRGTDPRYTGDVKRPLTVPPAPTNTNPGVS